MSDEMQHKTDQMQRKMQEIQHEMRELEEKLLYHSKKYYDDDMPEISDYDYDLLFERLKALEKAYPELISLSSPTRRISGHISEKFNKYSHSVHMGSLTDVFDFDGVMDFDKKIKSEFPDATYVTECKIDGLSVSLEYIDGVFVRGATRGNGYIGEDVTQNLLTIRSIPLVLTEKVKRLIVRGEVYMPKKIFAMLNEKREDDGLMSFANPRNAAAGSLRQLDSSLCAERRLDIFVFNVQLCEENAPKYHSDSLEWLQKLGFVVSPKFLRCKTCDEIVEKIKSIGETRSSLEYDIDGAVVKVDSLEMRRELGEVGAVPKWAVAYKYPPETAKTEVLDIEIQVGRTGVLTPKALLKTVKLAGSSISFATLHNIDYINEKDIRIGDTVFLRKAGDIIPEIVEVDKSVRKLTALPFEMPKVCPSCGGAVTREMGEAAVRCTNFVCPAQLHRNLTHFVSRAAMNIETLGESVLKRLLENGLISSAADLYYLSADALSKMERMGEKSAQNIINSLEKSKKNQLSRLIYALGIRHIGEKTARSLAEKFLDIDAIMAADFDTLCSIDDIGAESANSVINFFSVDANKKTIERLKNAQVNMIEIIIQKGTAFEGKIVVVTGTLPTLKRDEAEEMIAKNGGKASSSVSKKTSFVLAGEGAGSKLTKAKELGIVILDESDFLKMIKNSKK